MMKIDTILMDRWHNKTVLLEFEHGPVGNDGSRCTEVRLVEFMSYVLMADRGSWKKVPGGWKRTIWNESSRCSPKDQFCKETGRRVALARLADRHGVGWKPPELAPDQRRPLASPNPLVAAAIYQYYTRRRRK